MIYKGVPVLVDLTEAAALLRCSVKTVRRLQDRGDLPVVMMGRVRRIPTKALDKFIAQGGIRGSIREETPEEVTP